MRHSRMNFLAPAGFALSMLSFLLTVFSALCIFGVMLNSTVGAIVGILALVASSIGLTMTAIARRIWHGDRHCGLCTQRRGAGALFCIVSIDSKIQSADKKSGHKPLF